MDFTFEHIESLLPDGRNLLIEQIYAPEVEGTDDIMGEVVGFFGVFEVQALQNHFLAAVDF